MPDIRFRPEGGPRTDSSTTQGSGTGGSDGSGASGSGPGDSGTGEPGGGDMGTGRSEAGGSGASGGAPSAAALRAGLLVARASTAARSGQLDAAARLLTTVPDPEVAGRRDVLDLLARVHAQRGELTEAAECWRRVREQEPEDQLAASAVAGLARIERLRRKGPAAALGRNRVRTAQLAVLCLATAATALVVVIGSQEKDPGPKSPGPSAGDQLRPGEDPEAVQDAELAALARELSAPGVRAQVRAGSVQVTFAEGLFVNGAVLTPSGTDRLTALGKRLTGNQDRVTVYGQSAVVPGAASSGGSYTSLWRALEAARVLSTASGRPFTDFSTASADQREGRGSSDAVNRTVRVVITPKGAGK